MKNLRYLCLLCALAVCTMLPTGCIERPDEVPGPDDTAKAEINTITPRRGIFLLIWTMPAGAARRCLKFMPRTL